MRASYALEYGTDTLEIHDDAVKQGQRVLIVDDLLATGGTARATADLVSKIGGTVHALAFLIELVALNGRDQAAGRTDPRVAAVLAGGPSTTSRGTRFVLLLSALIVAAAVLWAGCTSPAGCGERLAAAR